MKPSLLSGRQAAGDAFQFQDTFTDTNGTNIESHTPDVQPSTGWSTQSGTFAISSTNSLQCTAVSSQVGYTVIDMSAASGTLDVNVAVGPVSSSGNNMGLVFRWSDTSNYWLFRWVVNAAGTVDGFYLTKYASGTPTTPDSDTTLTDFSAGENLSVVLDGSSIECYRDEELVLSTTDSHNSTATEHGIFVASTSTLYNQWRWDDLTFTV